MSTMTIVLISLALISVSLVVVAVVISLIAEKDDFSTPRETRDPFGYEIYDAHREDK